uniref:Uncharacterized protein n=1 Tax=Tanacetum cinerariifolium TaxID=118510 RepID=A0A699KEG3_TANCI|nr:hypothetical protein [Tanacetum cinerariifolium]
MYNLSVITTIDETRDADDEEYVRINEELYGDVNVEMEDVKPADEGKGDEEITDAEQDNVEKSLEKVNVAPALLVTIKSEVPIAVKEYLRTNLGDTLHKKQALFKTMIKSKSFNKHLKHMTLYHAFMESILADEDAMDQGIADLEKQKKIEHTDGDRDEDPHVGSD